MDTDQTMAQEYLTHADIPELVKSVADAMLVQLRTHPAPEGGSRSGSSSVETGEWEYWQNPSQSAIEYGRTRKVVYRR